MGFLNPRTNALFLSIHDTVVLPGPSFCVLVVCLEVHVLTGTGSKL
jgi:hypothetical protein